MTSKKEHDSTRRIVALDHKGGDQKAAERPITDSDRRNPNSSQKS
jgi:hypothetical protein